MFVSWEGSEYTFDFDEIDVAQARYIQRTFNLTLVDLEEGMTSGNPDALVALYWLMMSQNGKTIDASKVNFKLIKFAKALVEAVKKEQEENPTDEPAQESPSGQKT